MTGLPNWFFLLESVTQSGGTPSLGVKTKHLFVLRAESEVWGSFGGVL